MSEARLDPFLRKTIDAMHDDGRYRVLRPMGVSDGGRTLLNGREVINFSSNNYMGLSRHPELMKRVKEWTDTWGVSSVSSRLICGTLEIHESIERKIAEIKGSEDALIFNSGYSANSSVLTTILSATDCLVFADKLNHSSMHHGCQAAGVRQVRFRHNDLDHLETLLSKHQDDERPKFILTESVFSMDGDASDIDALCDIAKRHNAFLYVDEAHATGAVGLNGFGLCAGKPVDFTMGTFSKGLGGYGAYVACSKMMKEYLVNKCSGFIYATALPPTVLAAMDAALDILPGMEEERAHLVRLADKLRAGVKAMGLDTGISTTQIVPVLIGDENKTLEISRKLEDAGIIGIAVRPPTVPPGGSRIRFAMTANHTLEDIDTLLAALKEAVA